MRKYFTFFFLVLLFAGCNENEEIDTSSQHNRMKHKYFFYSDTRSAQKDSSAFIQKNIPAGSILLKKRRLKPKEASANQETEPLIHKIDTSLLRKLIHLRDTGIEIDLGEPINRSALFSSIRNHEYSPMILLSHDRLVRINFDNDIFDNTDRYYTNGIRFDFISPFLKQSPLSWLMMPYWGRGVNYYGISIGQNMYTPYTTKVGGIHHGDRPYAAYLFFGTFKVTNDPGKRFRQTSELDLGVIGPSSFGDFVQKSFHNNVPTNNEPLGWEYQIQNDVILNYAISFEKGIISTRHFELNLNELGSFGTLYTNMGSGFQFRCGLMNPYFSSYGLSGMKTGNTKSLSRFQVYMFVTSMGKLIGYDATLEGGIFNRTSIYTLKSNNLCPLTYQGTIGITISYGGVRLDVEQFVLSPEFHGCKWHKWVHIGLTIGM